MNKKRDERFVINPSSFLGAIIADGIFKGLPYALALALSAGQLDKELSRKYGRALFIGESLNEIKRRGWRFMTVKELTAVES
jgi:hypothetical protein